MSIIKITQSKSRSKSIAVVHHQNHPIKITPITSILKDTVNDRIKMRPPSKSPMTALK
jgi:hypothetical protein